MAHLPSSTTSANSMALDISRDELGRRCAEISSHVSQSGAQIIAEATERALAKPSPRPRCQDELSNEVLQEIFSWTKTSQTPIAPFSRMQSPMQLAQVCSAWRAAAFSLPALWEGFECPIYLPPDVYDREEFTTFVENWVVRAGFQGVAIFALPVAGVPELSHAPISGARPQRNAAGTVPQGPTLDPWLLQDNKFNLVEDVIIPNASRIKNLRIVFPSFYPRIADFFERSKDFPLLKGLAIDFPAKLPKNFPLATSPSQNAILANTPRLQKLKFMQVPGLTILQFPINWSHITHLEVGIIRSEVWRNLLFQMTSLDTCVASLHDASPYELAPSRSLTLPRDPFDYPSLRKLDLTTKSFTSTFYMIEITYPNLQVLSIKSVSWFLMTQWYLTKGPGLALTEFYLTIRESCLGHMIHELMVEPGMAELTHFSVSTEPDFFFDRERREDWDTMIPAIAEGRLLPHLHTFEFDGGEMRPEMLVDLLVKKGFVSQDGESAVYPRVGEVGEGRSTSVAAPFRRVKVVSRFDLTGDRVLQEIREMVGVERFSMGQSSKTQEDDVDDEFGSGSVGVDASGYVLDYMDGSDDSDSSDSNDDSE